MATNGNDGVGGGHTPPPPVTAHASLLSAADKARLREQEIFRKELQAELSDKPKSVFNSENAKWLIATALIPISVWWYGWTSQQVVDNRQDVQQLTALLPGLTSTSPEARCVAAATLSMLVSVQGASEQLKATYDAINGRAFTNQKSGDAAARANAAQTAGCLKQSDTTSAPTPLTQAPPSDSKVPVVAPPQPTVVLKPEDLVYLQIYRDAQMKDATRLKDEIQRAGFPVLGIENVGTTHPDTAFTYPQVRSVDVRFYHAEDKQAALSLTTIINRVLPMTASATVHDLSGRSSPPKSGTLEIWLPCADTKQACGT